MNDFVQHMEDAKARLASDLRALADDAEALLQQGARDADAAYAAARERLAQRVAATREQLRTLEAAAREGSEEAVETARLYAGEHPWKSAGVAAASGMLVAMVVQGRDHPLKVAGVCAALGLLVALLARGEAR